MHALYRTGYESRMTWTRAPRDPAATTLLEPEYSRDVVERQTAHAERNPVTSAYAHAESLERLLVKPLETPETEPARHTEQAS